ncbi:segregation/condensation protein B, partial [Geobacillus thermodenitrificans]
MEQQETVKKDDASSARPAKAIVEALLFAA